MRLYSGMTPDFIRESQRNQIAERLKAAFFSYYRYNPSPGEVNSWRNSLRAMSDVLQIGKLQDHGILLEYQLPLSSKRLDCMVCGKSLAGRDSATIIELKQWEQCESAEPANVVSSWVGGRKRPVLHPSVQVGQYRQYLIDTHTAFHDDSVPVELTACSYLHNYRIKHNDPLQDAKFSDAIAEQPLFDLDGAEALAQHLDAKMAAGGGRRVLDRIEDSAYRPSRKLMDHVATAIESHSPWVLLGKV